MRLSLRKNLLNPCLAIASGLCITSGALMLFHIKTHFIVATHEISSIFFAASCLPHVMLNWKLLSRSLKGRAQSLLAVGVVCLFLAGMAYSAAFPKQNRLKRGKTRTVSQSVIHGKTQKTDVAGAPHNQPPLLASSGECGRG